MGRQDIRPFVWAALALACLAALALRPTAADREFQLLTLSLALAASAAGAAFGSSPAALPLPGLLLMVWTAWGLAPLPLEWLRRLAPHRAEAVESALAVGAEPWTSLSADPAAALRGAVILAGLFALFAVSRAAASSSPRAAMLLAIGLVGAGLAQSAVGIEQYLAAISSGVGEPVARGSFVNRGQFAAFLLVSLGAGAGLVAGLGPTLRRRPEWAAAALSAATLLGAGLVASMSRAALAAAVLVGALFLASAGRRARLAGLGLVAALAVGGLVTEAGDRLSRRFERLAVEGGDPGRLLVWRDSAPLAARHAVWGAGMGAYGTVFERGSAYFPRKSVDHAHSDLLETWVELGAVGFGLLFGGVAAVAWGVCRRAASPLALGALAGAAGPLLQSAVDLPLQSPAVAAGVACCLGLASGDDGARTGLRSWLRAGIPAAAATLLGFFYLHGGPPVAAEAFRRAEEAWAAGEPDRARALYLETLAAQPRAAAGWLRLSEIARSRGETNQALGFAQQAQRWEPFTLRTEWALADLELAVGERDKALTRFSALLTATPDMRPAALQALWRGGAPLEAIETAIGAADGPAAGDFLAFLARNDLHAELAAAYQRLVMDKGLALPEDEARYVARALENRRR